PCGGPVRAEPRGLRLLACGRGAGAGTPLDSGVTPRGRCGEQAVAVRLGAAADELPVGCPRRAGPLRNRAGTPGAAACLPAPATDGPGAALQPEDRSALAAEDLRGFLRDELRLRRAL